MPNSHGMKTHNDNKNGQFNRYLILVALVAAFGYALNLFDFFVSDDFPALYFLKAADIQQIFTGVNKAGFQSYRPLALLQTAFILKIAGLNPLAFHLTAAAWRALGAVLAALIAFEITSKNRTAALAAGSAFAVHPAHAENVAYISGLPSMASAVLIMAAVLCVRPGGGKLRRFLAIFAVFALCVAAALFHESGYVGPFICVPAMILFKDPENKPKQWALPSAGPVAALAVIIVIRAFANGGFKAIPWSGPVGLYMPRNIIRYLQLAAFPLPFDPISFAAVYKNVLFGVSLAFIALFIFLSRKKFFAKSFLFITGLFIAGCAPVSAYFPRAMHMPLVTFAVSLGAGVILSQYIGGAKSRWAIAVFAAWIVLLAGVSAVESVKWRRASDFTEKLVKTFPRSELCGPEKRELVVLCAPDSLNGAFVLRNGLDQALRLFGPLCPFTVDRYLLAGMRDVRSDAVDYRRIDKTTFEVSITGRQSGDYLLLPDAKMDRHLADIAVIGPVGYTITGEDRPYFTDKVKMSFDPEFIGKDNVSILVYKNGTFTKLDSELVE